MDALGFGIVTVLVFAVGAFTGWKLHARTAVLGERPEALEEQKQVAVRILEGLDRGVPKARCFAPKAGSDRHHHPRA